MGASVWHAGRQAGERAAGSGAATNLPAHPSLLIPHPPSHPFSPATSCSPQLPHAHPRARGLGVAGFSSQQIPTITQHTKKLSYE